jgi:hypothetical protein
MTNAVALAQGASNNVTFRNRIINGAMVIDQRNAGASGTASVYTVDRWAFSANLATKGTWQQTPSATETGFATRVTAGFTNYLAFTSNSSYSVAALDYFSFSQPIEGFNVADLAWGTAGAKTITLSAWVYSSLTGTFGGSLTNSGSSRCYPFTYTISSANTWTQINVTIAGDTSGTWLKTNGIGIFVYFSLGTGTTYSGTAGAWASSAYVSATGATSVVGTSGATFYITGVQLEAGSTATSFDYRPIGTELLLCQRYYETTSYPDASHSLATTRTGLALGGGGASNGYSFLVAKRTNAPTVTLYSRSGTSGNVSLNATGGNITGTAANIGGTGFSLINLGTVQVVGAGIESGWTVSAEL